MITDRASVLYFRHRILQYHHCVSTPRCDRVSSNVTMLVYYEIFNDITLAAAREKRLKEWKRQWKIDLIEKVNPNWRDLYQEIIQ